MQTTTTNPFVNQVLDLGRDSSDRVLYFPKAEHAVEEIPGGCMGVTHHLVAGSILMQVGLEAAWVALYDETAITMAANIQFIAKATVEGGQILATGEILRGGDTILSSQGRVYQGDRLVALVSATFMHRPNRER